MKTTLPLALVLCLFAATLAFAQPAADPNAAQRQQLQQRIVPLRQEIQSLQQRLEARYPGDISAEQIQQRIQTLQQQVEPLQQQLQALGAAPGGGFGGGRGGGRGGAVTVPDNATPDQLRDVIQRLQQQNQQLAQQGRGAQPAREPAPPPCVPVNPNATQEARDLLKKLCDVSGKGILTGQHNFPNHRTVDTERVHATTGKYPAIWGSDFGFTDGEDKDAITHRDLMIEEAKKQYAAGSIVYLCWHMLRPTEDEPGKADPAGGGPAQAGPAACRPASPTISGWS